MDNLFLFIVWKNAYGFKKNIISDIDASFSIRNVFSIRWSLGNWQRNLERFYGAKLEDIVAKIEECGKGEFALILVDDQNPKYEKRMTSRGEEIVNVNMFDKKSEYREMTGGGYLIHATNTIKETNHDLTLLFGLNIEDFCKQYLPSKKEILYANDLPGYNGWKNKNELFYVLNNCCNYVVLRDFENDLEELNTNSDYDVDILCENLPSTQKLINAEQIYRNETILYRIKIKNHYALFDIKYIGDDYYCLSLENDILENKEFHNGYYIPSSNYLYNSHLLHALIHKNNFDSEYNDRLAELYNKHDSSKNIEHYINMLSKWMIDNGYKITIYKNNPSKTNVNNIYLFDDGLYDSSIVKELEYIIKISNLEKENYKLNNELKIIKNTKGYKILESLRKCIIKVRCFVIK